jgi:hypothetical protein
MLFRHLSHSTSGSILAAVEGYAVSIVAHVVVLAVFFAPQAPVAPREDPETFQWAKFLLPRDRTAASTAVREHLTFFATATPGGQGTLMSDHKEPERLQLELPAGTGADDLAEVAAAPPPAPELPGDEIMTVLEVDTAAARYEDSAAPPYPPGLLEKKIEGLVAVQYVVDTTGRADTTSFLVLSATHADFAGPWRPAHMRFRAAIMNTQNAAAGAAFSFRIDTTLLAQQKKPRPPACRPSVRTPVRPLSATRSMPTRGARVREAIARAYGPRSTHFSCAGMSTPRRRAMRRRSSSRSPHRGLFHRYDPARRSSGPTSGSASIHVANEPARGRLKRGGGGVQLTSTTS